VTTAVRPKTFDSVRFVANGQQYIWRSAERRAEWDEYADLLEFAGTSGLTNQVTLYHRKMYELITHDRAEAVTSVVRVEAEGGRPLVFVQPSYPIPESFQVDIKRQPETTFWGNQKGTRRWFFDFAPADAYGAEIPVAAMRALRTVRNEGFQPERLWVGVEKEVFIPIAQPPPAPVRRPDPLLAVSFGRYVVPIAAWA
jgi:hypothetical protein